jgi:hypothetical protein
MGYMLEDSTRSLLRVGSFEEGYGPINQLSIHIEEIRDRSYGAICSTCLATIARTRAEANLAEMKLLTAALRPCLRIVVASTERVREAPTDPRHVGCSPSRRILTEVAAWPYLQVRSQIRLLSWRTPESDESQSAGMPKNASSRRETLPTASSTSRLGRAKLTVVE